MTRVLHCQRLYFLTSRLGHVLTFGCPGSVQVDAHEAYFNALRTRVEELRPLLQKVTRRVAVVLARIDVEHLHMTPERLTARGPNAREERCVHVAVALWVAFVAVVFADLTNHVCVTLCAVHHLTERRRSSCPTA
jgi:hypothetical protein